MKRSLSNFRLIIMLTVMLTFTGVVNAQRGHYNNHYNYNSNRHYSYNYNNNYRYAPVRFSTSYRYRPNYYYRPVYRPHYYRPAYRYRLPHFSHYGPAFGFRLSILPFGYSTIHVGRSPYYYNDGIYYRPYSNGGYEVTAPPLGAEVSRLPSGAKATVINGEKYYELGGTFYQEQVSADNRVNYKVVGTDGVLNTGGDYQDETSMNNVPMPNNDNIAPNVAPYVAPVVGSRVDKLPEGCKVVVIEQQKYYLSVDGFYYQEVIEGNSVRYEVTGTQAN